MRPSPAPFRARAGTPKAVSHRRPPASLQRSGFDPAAPAQVAGDDAPDALSEIAQRLSHAATTADLERIVLAAARTLARADGATLVLRDGDDCVHVPGDRAGSLASGRRHPMSACIGGWCMRHGRVAAVEDLLADARGGRDACLPASAASLLMVPILGREPLGAIGVVWAERHRATGSEVALLHALAASTAVALEYVRMGALLTRATEENARLAQELERRRSTEEDLRTLCERDALTGLLNRRAWDMAVAGSLRKRRRPMYAALMDLDCFKDFNDRHGHPAADALLRRAAVAWRGALRTADVLARYGGDEFGILLAGCGVDSALEILERVRAATVDGQSVSIGVASWDGREGADSLVSRADGALYDAKRAGRGRVVLAS
jgi:diguanylate cyclase (GGDEF)-like protein